MPLLHGSAPKKSCHTSQGHHFSLKEASNHALLPFFHLLYFSVLSFLFLFVFLSFYFFPFFSKIMKKLGLAHQEALVFGSELDHEGPLRGGDIEEDTSDLPLKRCTSKKVT